MKHSTWITSSALAAIALLGWAREARADVALAGDFDIGLPVAQTPAQSFLSTGAGFDFRLGYRFRIPYQPLFVTPEIAAGYTDLSAHLVRVRPGVRVGFGRLIVPYAYGHMGYGWTSYDPLGSRDALGNAPFVSAGGLSLDVGAGVDITILRRLTVGGHIGYNVTRVGQVDPRLLDWRAQWMSFGLNATFYL
jgi:hypothetical protein